MATIALPEIVARLKKRFGTPKAPSLATPWEMILWVNVAYLANDDQRLQAFQTLKKRIGTDPNEILAAPDEELLEVTRHGMAAEQFAEKLRQCARIALREFDGDLKPILKLPLAKAKKSLMKFPGIGEPGAEKILLFTRTAPLLALDSKGLRVLLRLGYGKENRSYSTTYRLVQKAVVEGLDLGASSLIEAHLLLCRHGQELCLLSKPLCDMCPLAAECRYYRRV
jgi:endonuclease III